MKTEPPSFMWVLINWDSSNPQEGTMEIIGCTDPKLIKKVYELVRKR